MNTRQNAHTSCTANDTSRYNFIITEVHFVSIDGSVHELVRAHQQQRPWNMSQLVAD